MDNDTNKQEDVPTLDDQAADDKLEKQSTGSTTDTKTQDSMLEKIKSNKKVLIGTLVAIIVLGGALVFIGGSSDEEADDSSVQTSQQEESEEEVTAGDIQGAEDIQETIDLIKQTQVDAEEELNQLEGFTEQLTNPPVKKRLSRVAFYFAYACHE